MLGLGLANLGYTILVVLGVGLLIFVHELGHFIAAKLAGVRVETFSLGFGKKILSWKRGSTDYCISLVPLGGYVKMYGELPGEGDPNDPESLTNKSIAARFWIFSGGVLMNLVFAIIAFPIVFKLGVPFVAPVLGRLDPGGAAQVAGLAEGDRVLEVDGVPVHSFKKLMMEVALSGEEGTRFKVERKAEEGGQPKVFEATVKAKFREEVGVKTLGAMSPFEPGATVQLDDQFGPENPAKAAGLRNGDRILAVDGIPFSSRAWLRHSQDWLANASLWKDGKRKLRLLVGRDDAAGNEQSVEVAYTPKIVMSPKRLGVQSPNHRVLAVHDSAALHGLALQPGTVLLSVIQDGNRRLIEDGRSLVNLLASAGPGAELEVQQVPLEAKEAKGSPVKRLRIPDALRGLDAAKALRSSIDLAPANRLSSTITVRSDAPAYRVGLRSGDRIVRLAGEDVRNFLDIIRIVRAREGEALTARWQPFAAKISGQAPAPRTATIRAEPLEVPRLGFLPKQTQLRETFRVSGLGASLVAGIDHSVDTLRQLYVTLKRILGGSVSAKNLGGIITIGVLTYEKAKSGFSELLFWLAVLSLNLGFINVLPIPLLDGGHLVFLLIEKIKGSPVSVQVMNYAQVVGLVMVLALMIFVTFNDIVRHLF